ncbi:E3 ubiquitin-protein ligase Su(dx) [Armadillidium vulgare]|nr:E3 ubiquitin-protein ligase Su(dx) [Armadillidium vulgare]
MFRFLRKHGLLLAVLLTLIALYHFQQPCVNVSSSHQIHKDTASGRKYNRDEPLIFIGGMPRSGTTLARAMLDAHPEIRCGEETRVLNEAISSFILEVVIKHGDSASRLCNKDPFTLKSAVYLSQLFPNAKFLFMVRDGRATVHSIISRKVTITGFDLTSYRQCLERWNTAIQTMNNQCEELGPDKCLRVYYEQLVLKPKEWMTKILTFLGIPWNDVVLHHEQLINKPGGISLSKVERSSDQVIKPVYLDALTKWVGQIPSDVVEDMAKVAPMLAVLGYDPLANPPSYGKPDAMVANNTLKIQKDSKKWQSKAQQVLQHSKSQDLKDSPNT